MGYYVKPIVCDYGVYNDYDNELCLVCNRKANAELIVKILQVDNGDDAEHHHDKVCRDYEINYTRKPMDRIIEKLEEAAFPQKFGGNTEMMILKNRAIEIVKKETGV